MKQKQDYLKDIAEIREMMEKSSKFLSLSGWSGIFAGIYSLAGAYVAITLLNFNPDAVVYKPGASEFPYLVTTALSVLIISLITAVLFSVKKAGGNGQKVWNPASRRLVSSMALPLASGGVIIMVLIKHDLLGLAAPIMLIFYGLALYNGSKHTIEEVKWLGFAQLTLGLISLFFIQYGMLFWAAGFGMLHIIYGIYMYYRYDR